MVDVTCEKTIKTQIIININKLIIRDKIIVVFIINEI